LRRLLLLRLLRLAFRRSPGGACSPTAAATPFPAGRLLVRRDGSRLRLLLLRRSLRSWLLRFGLRLLLRASRLLRRLRRSSTLPLALALRLPVTPTGALLSRWALFAARSFARPLFEFADLAVHVAAGLLLLAIAGEVVPAIGAAFPSLGICSLAGRAENRFRERHL
jgi:hypothetical protein